METITYILLGLTILMLVIGLIIEYRPREKEEEKIAVKARSSRSDPSGPGPFEPTLYIKKITYDMVPLKIAYLLPDISDEAIQQAMDFCKQELLKSAANSIDYRIEDCFPDGGKKLTARLIVANSQSSRDADC